MILSFRLRKVAIHEKLDSDYREFDDKFHFGWPEPMDTFPELLAAIEKYSS
jgi:hypothetical protein